MMRAGVPAAMTSGGMSLVTTLPAPMMDLSPMVMPGLMMAAPPIQTSAPMVMGFADSIPVRRSAASMGWVAV